MAARESGILDHRAAARNEACRPRSLQLNLNRERHGPGTQEDGAGCDPSSSDSENELQFLKNRTKNRTPPRPPRMEESEDEEEDEEVSPQSRQHGRQKGPGDCEVLLKQMNNDPKVLLSMATGLTTSDGKRKLADFEDDPLCLNIPSKNQFKPTAIFFKEEMKRRARNAGLNMKKFKKDSLSRKQALEWLLNNPIRDPVDVSFVRREEGVLYKTVIDAAKEAEENKKEKLLTGNWTGPSPWLRLCAAMCEDECRSALAQWNRSMTREELDARNSAVRPMTHWQKVCDKHNDSDWVVIADPVPELHSDFEDSILLQLRDMPGGPLSSAEEARKKGAEARAKLMQVRHLQQALVVTVEPCPLTRFFLGRTSQIIANWEASGNGLGQREVGDDGCGHCEAQTDGDNRASFIQQHMGHRNHHLHFWHLSDKMGILDDVLNTLSYEVAADSDNVRTNTQEVVTKRKRMSEDQEEKQHKKSFRNKVGTSLACIALNDKAKELRMDEEKLDKCELVFMDLEDDVDLRREQFYSSRIHHLKDRIHQHQTDIERMRKEIGLPVDDEEEEDDDVEEEGDE